MKFNGFSNNSKVLGSLNYWIDEYSFDFQSEADRATASISIGTLQISINSQGKFLGIWGYYPYTFWKRKSLHPPVPLPGEIYASLEEKIVPGISEELVSTGEWVTSFDPGNGWLCIKSPEWNMNPSSTTIEFASNCIGVIDDHRLMEIWIYINEAQCEKLKDLVR
ncbi:hypothetical protein [Baaleninema simplex]|uniref:hypothetical protein n=1 Tax=Baaleninema simplex TaxID=2862350 RepID=UPI00037A1E45|nr:hypothetical protein [Baaleninema simplex]